MALVYAPTESLPGARGQRGDGSTRAGGSSDRTRRLRPGRPYVGLALALLFGAWLVIVFGGALTELNEATERAAEVRAESAALQARLDAGRREAELAQTDGFLQMQARAYGMGLPGELPFALEPDAPPPPPVTPLGQESAVSAPQTPLESWLRLLFGGD